MTTKVKTIALIWILGILILRIGAHFVEDARKWISLDFYPVLAAAELLHNGENPYDINRLDTVKASYSGSYIEGDIASPSPCWVFIYQLFHIVGATPSVSAFLWFGLSVVFILLGVFFSLQLTIKKTREGGNSFPKVLVLFILFYFPLYGTLFIGQITSVGFLCIALSCFYVRQGKYNHAAISLAIAGAAKTFPLFALAFFIVYGPISAFFLGVSTYLLLQVPAAIQRPSIFFDFLNGVLSFSKKESKTNAILVANQSLRGFMLRLTRKNQWSFHINEIPTKYLQFSVSVAIWLICLYVIRNRRKHISGANTSENVLPMFLVVLVLASISSPFLWHHTYLVLLPVYMYNLNEEGKKGLVPYAMLLVQHLFDYFPSPIPVIYYIPPATSLALFSTGIIVRNMLKGHSTRAG